MTTLIFPPSWTLAQPYLALPVLVAELVEKGHDVTQLDFNVRFYDKVLSKQFITMVSERLRLCCSDDKMIKLAEFCALHVETYKQSFRSQECMDVSCYLAARGFFSSCFKVINEFYADEIIGMESYETKKYSERSLDDLLKLSRDVKSGAIHGMIMHDIIRCILKETVDFSAVSYVGISLTGESQIVPGFMIAAMIKKINPRIRVIAGGNIVTRWKSVLCELPALFDDIDYFVVHSAEDVLYDLIQCENDCEKLKFINNLVFRDKCGKIISTSIIHRWGLNSHRHPIFSVAELGLYFSPKVVLPYIASYGCYWKMCAFCDHSYVYGGLYKCVEIKSMCSAMKHYMEVYNCHHVNFCDEAMSPVHMKSIAKAFESDNVKIEWSTCARLDGGFTEELLRDAYNQGLRVLFFGLESINDETLMKINKGISADESRKVLAYSAAVGIWNHVFFICGLPGESTEDVCKTAQFVRTAKGVVHTAGCSLFTVGKHSSIARDPRKYEVDLKPTGCLSVCLDHDTANQQDIAKTYQKMFLPHMLEYDYILSRQIFRDHWIVYAKTLQQSHDTILSNVLLKRCMSGVCYVIDEDARIFALDYVTCEVLLILINSEYGEAVSKISRTFDISLVDAKFALSKTLNAVFRTKMKFARLSKFKAYI